MIAAHVCIVFFLGAGKGWIADRPLFKGASVGRMGVDGCERTPEKLPFLFWGAGVA